MVGTIYIDTVVDLRFIMVDVMMIINFLSTYHEQLGVKITLTYLLVVPIVA